MRQRHLVILLLAAMTLFFAFIDTKAYMHHDEDGITRAQTARMLAWRFCDMNEDSSKSDETLIDVDQRIWYADDIAAVLSKGLMEKNGDQFRPTEFLTWQEAAEIADKLGQQISIPWLQKRRPIPLEQWLNFYYASLTEQKMTLTQHLKIEALPSTSSELKEWQVRTDAGIFIYEGLSLDAYLGQTITADVYADQILMVLPETMLQPEMLYASDTQMSVREETEEAPVMQDIRVCIMNDDFSSETHDRIQMTSEAQMNLTFKDHVVQSGAEDIITLTTDDLQKDGESVEITAAHQAPITILSLQRSCGHPVYQGSLRVIRSGDALYLVNILPLETYLKGVVPSEMPASGHPEALKAQAVCARSYAVSALQNPKYDFADLNDSTACQVYMNQPEDERTNQAVAATTGAVLMYQQKVVTAKYFSSSCGSLSSSEAIWSYPESDISAAYMTNRLETEPPSVPHLENEEAFRNFMLHPEPDTYIEASEPWFRWHVTVSLSTIRNNVERLFAGQMRADPKRFSVLSTDGDIHTEDILEIIVLQRAESGVLQKIKLTGKNQELTMMGEYNIRRLLAPAESESVILQDGSSREGMSLLPSGYFCFDPVTENDTTTGYIFYGGGFGHGAGLSQNGADILAEKGYDYKSILEYYFEGINIQNVNTLRE